MDDLNKMVSIKDIVKYLENFAPIQYQESYDNSGLIYGKYNKNIAKILISLDITEEVILEAKKKRCNFIISHHPLIFKSIKKINCLNYVERALVSAIKNDIAIYTMHTNFDNISEGMPKLGASLLNLSDYTSLSTVKLNEHANVYKETGVVGYLRYAMKEKEFISFLKKQFNIDTIKHSPFTDKNIKKIAFCGGSGSFLIPNAIDTSVDAYISADFKYHDFFYYKEGIFLCDIGHYESEIIFKAFIKTMLLDKFPKLNIITCKTITNPVNYS